MNSNTPKMRRSRILNAGSADYGHAKKETRLCPKEARPCAEGGPRAGHNQVPDGPPECVQVSSSSSRPSALRLSRGRAGNSSRPRRAVLPQPQPESATGAGSDDGNLTKAQKRRSLPRYAWQRGRLVIHNVDSSTGREARIDDTRYTHQAAKKPNQCALRATFIKSEAAESMSVTRNIVHACTAVRRDSRAAHHGRDAR